MFSDNDEKYLVRALSTNKCVLFLGAGFSGMATNRAGAPMPTGRQFAEALWHFLGYSGAYDGSALTDLFEVFVNKGLKLVEKMEFLERHLMCGNVPDVYNIITTPFWNRIYTTNVDDLLATVYRRTSTTRLKCLAYPDDYSRERDQSLRETQAIFLNGRLPCDPQKLTFSFMQYAGAATTHAPLYDQFVSDYSTHPTVFIGTQLNEPLLWQYIQARQSKNRQLSERRPRSFLISSEIPGPRADALKQFNVVPVIATTEQFLDWLKRIALQLPSHLEVLRTTLPGVVELIEGRNVPAKTRHRIEEFAACFEPVPTGQTFSKERSAFLLGATPRWADIGRDLDAPREVGGEVAEEIRNSLSDANAPLPVFALIGSAGCGKSTILRRIGFTLAQEGHPCFLTNSEELPQHGAVSETLEALERRAVLLFDNAETNLNAIGEMCRMLASGHVQPVVVIAARTNEFRRKTRSFRELDGLKEVVIPNLTRPEVLGIIDVLDRNNLLGKLQGMTQDQRIAEFERRASKQILVAMREATSGRFFDEIIRDEFSSLTPDEAKILYLAVALATDAGHRLALEDFVGCSSLAAADTLDLLEVSLRDIVLRTGNDSRMLVLRHKRIAEYMVDVGADRRLLMEGYVRVLSVLAGKTQAAKWSSAIFRLYRRLINHYTISTRFAGDHEQARIIFDSLASRLSRDTQFWLQYGSLELQADDLDLADNYLHQADSLDPNNGYIRNALGHLAYRRAILANSRADAEMHRIEAREKLDESMNSPQTDKPHCYHITLTQELRWILKWVTEKNEQARYLDDLRKVGERARREFADDRSIERAATDVDRHYFMIATD